MECKGHQCLQQGSCSLLKRAQSTWPSPSRQTTSCYGQAGKEAGRGVIMAWMGREGQAVPGKAAGRGAAGRERKEGAPSWLAAEGAGRRRRPGPRNRSSKAGRMRRCMPQNHLAGRAAVAGAAGGVGRRAPGLLVPRLCRQGHICSLELALGPAGDGSRSELQYVAATWRHAADDPCWQQGSRGCGHQAWHTPCIHHAGSVQQSMRQHPPSATLIECASQHTWQSPAPASPGAVVAEPWRRRRVAHSPCQRPLAAQAVGLDCKGWRAGHAMWLCKATRRVVVHAWLASQLKPGPALCKQAMLISRVRCRAPMPHLRRRRPAPSAVACPGRGTAGPRRRQQRRRRRGAGLALHPGKQWTKDIVKVLNDGITSDCGSSASE